MAALACAAGALLIGAGLPAQAATPESGQQSPVSASYHFGTYYTLEACRYYGESLVAGPQFNSYNCSPYWYPNDPQMYWALYVYP
jgi:hypothetical protein